MPSTMPGPAAGATCPGAPGRRDWPDGDPDAPWRMLFSARGRISRRRFWLWGVGALLGLGFVLRGLLGIAGVAPLRADAVVNLVLLWPALAVSIKRWHDRDRSGWWVLVALVPVVGWLWLLWANGCLRGTPGANRYGPPPPA
jgi:uncharacterized membrane protein YhaH (DUF805 family)